MFRNLIGSATSAAFVMIAAVAAGQGPVKPETYFSHEDLDAAQLSPSGKLLAALAPVNGRRVLVSMDLAARKPRRT